MNGVVQWDSDDSDFFSFADLLSCEFDSEAYSHSAFFTDSLYNLQFDGFVEGYRRLI